VLEPLYSDYRRVAFRETSGKLSILHMDEIVDKLLREDHFCEVMLPRIPKRWVLEDIDKLKEGPRETALQDNDDSEDEEVVKN